MMQETRRNALRGRSNNVPSNNNRGFPREIPLSWTDTSRGHLQKRDLGSRSRSHDNDLRHRNESVALEPQCGEARQENSGIEPRIQIPTPSPSESGDSYISSPSSSSESSYLHNDSSRASRWYSLKNEILVRNPRDGYPHLLLEPGTEVEVYYNCKSNNNCWITRDSWDFGWCIERSDLEDKSVGGGSRSSGDENMMLFSQ